MHPAIPRLANHFGIKLWHRNCHNNFTYNGKTLSKYWSPRKTRFISDGRGASQNEAEALSDHVLMHEIAHFAVADERQRKVPNFGLGSFGLFGTKSGYFLHRIIPEDEGNIQEFMTQSLCAKWGDAYGISTYITDDSVYSQKKNLSWNEYLKERINCAQVIRATSYLLDQRWQALFRLQENGMMQNLPITY